MDTMSIRAAAAAVTGARHVRGARNGQDAAVTWSGPLQHGQAEIIRPRPSVAESETKLEANPLAADATPLDARSERVDAAIVVVSDGCSSGASSEVGARLGASLYAGLLGARLQAGESVTSPVTWAAVRADVVRVLAELVEHMGDRAQAIHDHFLFTIVAAAVTRGGAAVWALGDGAYSLGDDTRVLGPFADNAPPYLAYDLLGDARPAHFEIAPAVCGSIVIATDGATELDGGLERFATQKLVEHPDALRRQLALLARATERIEWDERRVVRTPAALQDDCAVGVLRWSFS